MSVSSPRGESAEDASTGASTQTVVETESVQSTTTQPQLRLYLRERPGITWSEDTIDTEGLGRKSSKRCCIFHKVKKFAESDSDESDEDPEQAKKDAAAEGSSKLKNLQRHHA
jgi:protein phosphatase 1 regulatory subunit 11